MLTFHLLFKNQLEVKSSNYASRGTYHIYKLAVSFVLLYKVALTPLEFARY